MDKVRVSFVSFAVVVFKKEEERMLKPKDDISDGLSEATDILSVSVTFIQNSWLMI